MLGRCTIGTENLFKHQSSPSPKKIALPVSTVPFSLLVALDEAYNGNAGVNIRGVAVILTSVLLSISELQIEREAFNCQTISVSNISSKFYTFKFYH
jgi:hypothetical protein